MFDKLKSLWDLLFHSKQLPVDQEVHPMPTEIVEAKSVEEVKPVLAPQPVSVDPKPVTEKTTTVTPEVNWPFPKNRPEDVVQPKPAPRKRRSPPKVAAVTAPKVPAESVKKTPKEIAAERRKAEGNKDRLRAKRKK